MMALTTSQAASAFQEARKPKSGGPVETKLVELTACTIGRTEDRLAQGRRLAALPLAVR